jgi:Uma2 family endonuclease
MLGRSPITLPDWAALDEDDSRELVDGVLQEAEVPSVAHEIVVGYLHLLLAPYFRARGGLALGSGVKLAIGGRRGRVPDVVCFGPEHPLPREGVVEVAPEIVVEVISSRPDDQRRDRIEKPQDYAAIGARYCWLVDPMLRSVEILELDAHGRYVRVLACTSGTVEPPGTPGLVLDVDAMWAELERLPQ